MPHTPGEWTNEGWIIVSHEAKSAICEISKPHATKHVAHVPMGYTTEHLEEAAANARLIEAAPAMYKALDLLLLYIGWWEPNGPDSLNIKESIRSSALSALAKVRGKQRRQ